MCTVCGCDTASIEGEILSEIAPEHTHAHAHTHAHEQHVDHGHTHTHAQDGGLIDFSRGPAGMHIQGISEARTISVERSILAKNDALAKENRSLLFGKGVFALNLVSSPGSGKTSLLVRMITDMGGRRKIAVIEGDQQTSHDADRIRATGAPAVQINTGKGCHLDAHMVGHALDHLPLEPGCVLFIENVGNLVCPAPFDLGEAHKIVVLSVTEGEDKPLKYPDMFAAADLMLLNKCDLLPFLDFDVAACLSAARRVNPRIQILMVSARTGEGLPAFYAWIESRAAPAGVST
jgi:hydrogenase nickel incorporation protein HypB